MRDKKSLIVFILLFALFNVLAFLIPAQRAEGFWVAYAFTVAAFILLFCVWYKSFKAADTLESKFMHLPVLSCAVIYLIIQATVFAVAMAVPVIPVWIITVICAVLFVIFLIFTIAANTGAAQIQNIDAKVAQNTEFIRRLTLKAENLANSESNPELKRELTTLYEKIRYSDPVSSPALNNIENKIENQFNTLAASPDKQKIQSLILLIDERNAEYKSIK